MDEGTSTFEGTGTYAEERLLIIDRLRRLEAEAKEDTKVIGVLQDRVSKLSGDIDVAHDRIRDLKQLQDEQTKLSRRIQSLEVRAGYIAAGSGAIIAGFYEWIRHLWK
jgi:hypothetical protein